MSSLYSNNLLPDQSLRKILIELDDRDLCHARLVNKQWSRVGQSVVVTEAVTVSAPVNIAVIKYWGKRDEKLILPINSSLSGTLNQRDLRSTTSIRADRRLRGKDRLSLNGSVVPDIGSSARLQNCLTALRQAPPALGIPAHLWARYGLDIVSINNFPTAAGLASSASGYAALAYALAQFRQVGSYHGPSSSSFSSSSAASTFDGLSVEEVRELSKIARMGSGSACRSLFGGFVAWNMGVEADGSDSYAEQLVDHLHWPEMQILVLVVSAEKKAVGSTEGMQSPVEGDLLNLRAKNTVPPRMIEISKAIRAKDMPTFAQLTMLDSDDFHNICHHSIPALHYMNQVSFNLQKLVTAFNAFRGHIHTAYTYDAGPNAVIYLLQEELPLFLSAVYHFFPHKAPLKTHLEQLRSYPPASPEMIHFIAQHSGLQPTADQLAYVLHTDVGPGPQILSSSECLFSN